MITGPRNQALRVTANEVTLARVHLRESDEVVAGSWGWGLGVGLRKVRDTLQQGSERSC